MKYYLTIFRNAENNKTYYTLTKSRNAMKLIEQFHAKGVWVYDKDGWWISHAWRSEDGKTFRPRMMCDGEPRLYYAKLFAEMKQEMKSNHKIA